MFDIEYKKKPEQYIPLSQAYIGDAVYEMYVRSRILAEYEDMPPSKLHIISIGYVKAAAQADAVKYISERFNKKEEAVFKRGRNSKSHTVPKNADVTDYRYATGFEALIGYLYLSGEYERAEELMRISYDYLKDKIKKVQNRK